MNKLTKKRLLKILIPCFFIVTLLFGFVSLSNTVIAEKQTITDIKLYIDFAPYEDDYPEGVVGKSYKIFPATAKDNLNNDVAVDVLVTNPVGQVLALNNQRFDTETVGEYVITYKAQVGTIQKVETVKINVKADCEVLNYEPSDKINDNGITGEMFYLYDGIETGGSGQIDVTVSVLIDGQTVELIENEYTQYFIPTKGGEYVIKYNLTDFVENQHEEIKLITVVDSDLPILGNPSISLVNKKGDKVTLPMIDAILYRHGNRYFVPVKVEFDDEDITDKMSYVADTVGEHVIKYSAENVFTGQIAEKEFLINVVDPTESHAYVSNYLNMENLTGSYPQDSEGYVLTCVDNGNAGFQFASKIYQEFADYNIKLYGDNSENCFKALNLMFTDSIDGKDKVTIKIFDVAGTYTISNCGIICYQGERSLLNTLTEGISYKYDYVNGAIVDSLGTTVVDIKTYDDGRTFNGFTSKYVYWSCSIDEMAQGASISITSIASNNITKENYDLGKPMFYNLDNFSQSISADIGEKIRLFCPKAYDLFDNDNIIYTANIVYKGTKYESVNQKIFDGQIEEYYDLKIENAGDYRIEFYATDSSNQARRLVATVHVADRISPEIEIEFNYIIVKKGKTIKIPKAKFKDDVSQNVDCDSLVYVSHGTFLKDLVYEKYKFTKTGKYIFTYQVWDKAGNCTLAKFVVICK